MESRSESVPSPPAVLAPHDVRDYTHQKGFTHYTENLVVTPKKAHRAGFFSRLRKSARSPRLRWSHPENSSKPPAAANMHAHPSHDLASAPLSQEAHSQAQPQPQRPHTLSQPHPQSPTPTATASPSARSLTPTQAPSQLPRDSPRDSPHDSPRDGPRDGQREPRSRHTRQQLSTHDLPRNDSSRHDASRNASVIEETIAHPGTVRINVQGAFIVAEHEEPTTPQSEDYEHDPRDIRLPNHNSIVSHVAVDIGGSLAKLVYFSREASSTSIGGRLNFLKFETERIDTCIDFMRTLQADYKQLSGPNGPDLCVMATGGGAFKYYDRITEALGIEVMREDEMECLIIGLDFFITEIPNEVFTYSEDAPMTFVPSPNPPESIYPYLLVNIGSGVSMIKVSGPRQFERIGGTSLGGGTLWGLLSLLTGARNFEDMLKLAERGDNSTVDLLVGDIYGADYNKIGLKSTHIASSFGKVYKMKRAAERDAEDGCNAPFKCSTHMRLSRPASPTPSPDRRDESPSSQPTFGYSADDDESLSSHPTDPTHDVHPPVFKAEDISRSLLYAVSNNIGQIAYLHAEKHELRNIYFGGSFIGGHHQTMNTLSYAIRFWSKGTKQAYFLRHEGYLGAVGAFLKRQPKDWGRRGSFEARERGSVNLGNLGGVGMFEGLGNLNLREKA